tara:strand:+ start:442 stop:1311 length:870 start_codon:yes stop_codon:yes gene_type:complete
MKTGTLISLVLLALLLLVAANSFFKVDERERVLLFQLGEIRGADYEPGLHFKIPFVQSIQRFNKRLLTLDNQTESFLTVEKKNVDVDFFVKWRIVDTTDYYRATGGQELVAMDRLAAIVNPGLRAEFGSRTVREVVSGERNEILDALEKMVKTKVADLGIEIVDVRVKRVDLPSDVSDSVYQRMRAERTRVASDLRARGAEEAERLRANADREAKVTVANAYRDAEVLRGEGDAKAADIYAKSYGADEEFYRFYRSLNIYREGFGSRDSVLVLEPDGALFDYFKDDSKK